MDTIETGDYFIHTESGKEVEILNTGSFKVAESGAWVDCVSYLHPDGDEPHRVFTRTRANFNEKFHRRRRGEFKGFKVQEC